MPGPLSVLTRHPRPIRALTTLPKESGHRTFAECERPSSALGATFLSPARARRGQTSPRRLAPPPPAESLGMGGAGSEPQSSPELRPPLPARTRDLGGARGQLQTLGLPPGSHPRLAESRKRAAGDTGPPGGRPLTRQSRASPHRAQGMGTRDWFSPGLARPSPQEAPPWDRDVQGTRAGAAVPAAVSAPQPGCAARDRRAAGGPPPPDPLLGRGAAPCSQRGQDAEGCAPTFSERELRGAGPSAPHPSPARPAAAAGPATGAHLGDPCRRRRLPCPPWSRSPRPREEPPAQPLCPCGSQSASSEALGPGLMRRAAGALL